MRLNFEKLPNRALIGLAFAVLSACEYRQANGPPAPVKASSYDRGFEFGKQLALMQRDDPAAEVGDRQPP